MSPCDQAVLASMRNLTSYFKTIERPLGVWEVMGSIPVGDLSHARVMLITSSLSHSSFIWTPLSDHGQIECHKKSDAKHIGQFFSLLYQYRPSVGLLINVLTFQSPVAPFSLCWLQ